jgi:hypothetical protein
MRALPAAFLITLACIALVFPAEEFPSNGHIVYERKAADNSGTYDIYYIRADGSGNSLLLEGGQWPTWRPDGSKIAYNDKENHGCVMNPDGTGSVQLTELQVLHWMGTGAIICRNDIGDVYTVEYPGGTETIIARKSDFPHLDGKTLNPGGITHDGRWLVGHSDRYRGGYTGDNGRFSSHHCALMLDLQNREKVYFFGGGCEPTVPPAGDFIYHVSATIKKPSPARMLKGDVSRESYEAEIANDDGNWGHEYFPRISTDNNWMTYSATTGCHDHVSCPYQLFVHRLGAGSDNRKQLTTDSDINHRWPHMFVGALPGANTPEIGLSTSTVSFAAIGGEGNPPPRTVTVTNIGSGSLGAVTAQANRSWVTVTHQEQNLLETSVDITNMSIGDYDAVVTVSAAHAEDVTYDVSLSITEMPMVDSIAVTPAAAWVLAGDSIVYRAVAFDQQGKPLDPQPPFSWSCTGGGRIGADNGIFAAGEKTGGWDVSARVGTVERFARVGVTDVFVKMNAGDNSVHGWESQDAYADADSRNYTALSPIRTEGVAGAGPQELYARCRRDGPEFLFPPEIVPNGTYRVRLHFAEPHHDDCTVANRTIDVSIEGRSVLEGYDPGTAAGGCRIAVVSEHTVSVTDGNGMKLVFDGQGGDAFVMGMEIIRTGDRWVRLKAPNGGETFGVGDPLTVRWDAGSQVSSVVVALSIDNGRTYPVNITGSNSVDASTGELTFSLPANLAGQGEALDRCMVKVSEYNADEVKDVSDGPFTITGALDVRAGTAVGRGAFLVRLADGTGAPLAWIPVEEKGRIGVFTIAGACLFSGSPQRGKLTLPSGVTVRGKPVVVRSSDRQGRMTAIRLVMIE